MPMGEDVGRLFTSNVCSDGAKMSNATTVGNGEKVGRAWNGGTYMESRGTTISDIVR